MFGFRYVAKYIKGMIKNLYVMFGLQPQFG
jgi:hypothetical protein